MSVLGLGLALIIDAAEGYAYLKQRPQPDDTVVELPRLVGTSAA